MSQTHVTHTFRTLALLSAAVVSLCLLSSAGPAAAASPRTGVRVADLSGSGDWVVALDFSPALGLGITFDQKFSFQLRRVSTVTLPLDGGTAKLPVRVTVQSSASGTYQDATVDPPVVRPYTCTASSTASARATVRTARRGGALKVTVVPLRSLDPGEPTCSDPKANIFWPTGSAWFVRAITARASLARSGWFKPAAASWTSPRATSRCARPSA